MMPSDDQRDEDPGREVRQLRVHCARPFDDGDGEDGARRSRRCSAARPRRDTTTSSRNGRTTKPAMPTQVGQMPEPPSTAEQGLDEDRQRDLREPEAHGRGRDAVERATTPHVDPHRQQQGDHGERCQAEHRGAAGPVPVGRPLNPQCTGTVAGRPDHRTATSTPSATATASRGGKGRAHGALGNRRERGVLVVWPDQPCLDGECPEIDGPAETESLRHEDPRVRRVPHPGRVALRGRGPHVVGDSEHLPHERPGPDRACAGPGGLRGLGERVGQVLRLPELGEHPGSRRRPRRECGRAARRRARAAPRARPGRSGSRRPRLRR